MAIVGELARGLLQLLYPEVCHVCGRLNSDELVHVCTACRDEIHKDAQPVCPRCAASVGPFALVEGGCVHCRGEPFHFERVLRFGPYDGLLREVILRLKQPSGEALAEAIGQHWAEHAAPCLAEWQIDVVVPVPLHWRRRLRRGFNQSAVLADALASRLGVACRPRWLRRIRNTPQQTAQTPSARRDNVRGAFHASRRADFSGKTVLLIDDVLTTGSTCSQAARAVRKAGASRVFVAVLARSRTT